LPDEWFERGAFQAQTEFGDATLEQIRVAE
jgi:hypothetical protein